uniref:O-methyltransferase dimerisation domain-containing protein n=1 Tax=Zea mays TaxID=4577 RepID=C0HFC9_MAIZE|nr:unknown [Zea mays]
MAHQDAGVGGKDHRELQAQHTTDTEELLAAHRELWSHALGYVKSMALKCALDLGIPDTIQRYGGGATVGELAAASNLPASSLPFLRRLMRTLTAMRIFAVHRDDDPSDDPADDAAAVVSYQLTATSRLLVNGGSYFSIRPNISALVHQGAVSPMFSMSEWMKQHHHHAPDMTLHEMVHGEPCGSLSEPTPRSEPGSTTPWTPMPASSCTSCSASALPSSTASLRSSTSAAAMAQPRLPSPGPSHTSSVPSWTSLTLSLRLPRALDCASSPAICSTTSHRLTVFCSRYYSIFLIYFTIQTNLYQVYMPFSFSQNNLYSVIY